MAACRARKSGWPSLVGKTSSASITADQLRTPASASARSDKRLVHRYRSCCIGAGAGRSRLSRCGEAHHDSRHELASHPQGRRLEAGPPGDAGELCAARGAERGKDAAGRSRTIRVEAETFQLVCLHTDIFARSAEPAPASLVFDFAELVMAMAANRTEAALMGSTWRSYRRPGSVRTVVSAALVRPWLLRAATAGGSSVDSSVAPASFFIRGSSSRARSAA
jgi:hypothetical protein